MLISKILIILPMILHGFLTTSLALSQANAARQVSQNDEFADLKRLIKAAQEYDRAKRAAMQQFENMMAMVDQFNQ